MSSNETLDRNSASNLSEEEELRINSRMGEREPTPKWEIEETQETSSENTSAKSLESIAEENEELKQEIKYEELINTEPESDIELDNSYSSNDDLEIRLEQQAEDVFIEKTINESPSNYAKKHSDTKLKLPLRSLPVFSLASLKLQPKLQETKDWIVNSTSDSSTKSELAQELQNKDFNGESFSNCDLSTRLTPKEFAIVESDNNDKTSTNLEEKNESQLDVLESNLHESQDGKLDMNFQKVTVSKIKQMSKENPTISDLNQELQTRFELRSRSLPIFSLVSKKLQPKLQENKDLLNININANETSTSSEEKQKTEATMGFATTNHSNHDTTVEKESKVVEEEIHEIEDTKELYRSSGLNEMEDTEIQSDQEPEVKSTEKSASEEIPKSEIDTNESEWDEENFSERFKKLQSKWQEKDNYSTSHLGLKFEKIPNNSYKVKNVINDKLKEENILKSEETKPPEITVDVKCNVEDKTVKLQPPEEPSEEHLVHKMEINPKVETIVKVESTTIENYEFKLEHSKAEQKQEEAERILHLEEIHKLEASFDQLADKVCSWLDSCSSVLMVTSHPGPCFSEAHHSLTTHAHLQAQSGFGPQCPSLFRCIPMRILHSHVLFTI
ncbi:putative leucine-rich repeat-containing protein DDB_G0290503 [Boleophthalmus pectinirostris]|uniref:putative leucine-rich repeat-containing protein DDB_G0290503 n=1 Tax=Boleophthalmus pectinirostris TaxID=150288 RepID=UPI00242D156A|nr:putative leucine-rich repeat-containing protein DDB_G0290503 [Boleophthalmus pectinirostris]